MYADAASAMGYAAAKVCACVPELAARESLGDACSDEEYVQQQADLLEQQVLAADAQLERCAAAVQNAQDSIIPNLAWINERPAELRSYAVSESSGQQLFPLFVMQFVRLVENTVWERAGAYETVFQDRVKKVKDMLGFIGQQGLYSQQDKLALHDAEKILVNLMFKADLLQKISAGGIHRIFQDVRATQVLLETPGLRSFDCVIQDEIPALEHSLCRLGQMVLAWHQVELLLKVVKRLVIASLRSAINTGLASSDVRTTLEVNADMICEVLKDHRQKTGSPTIPLEAIKEVENAMEAACCCSAEALPDEKDGVDLASISAIKVLG